MDTTALLDWFWRIEPQARGTVSLVGAGPGDPGLISIKGAVRLIHADSVLFDHLIGPEVRSLVNPRAEQVSVGKRAGDAGVGQEAIHALMIEHAGRGRRVVRLKGGDPFIFGRGGEECEALAAAGVPFEVVPGVTAASGAAAYAGIPLTHRECSGTVALVTGHEASGEGLARVDPTVLARLDTIAMYMGLQTLPDHCARLMACGMSAETPAALVEWATRGDQRIITGTVRTIADQAQRENVQSPAMLLIGPVVRYHAKLAWFRRPPLCGLTVMVTRPAVELADPGDCAASTSLESSLWRMLPVCRGRGLTTAVSLESRLARLGATVVCAPTTVIRPLEDHGRVDAALRCLEDFDAVVLTSAHGVDAMAQRLRQLRLDGRALHGVRLAAVGKATAERLQDMFLEPDIVAPRGTSSSLADTLIEQGVSGKRILLLRSDRADEALPLKLANAGAAITDLAIYRTVCASRLSEEPLRMLVDGAVDWITFLSPSSLICMVKLLERAGHDARDALGKVKLACIGPTTAAAIRRAGLQPAVEPEEPTVEALVRSMTVVVPGVLRVEDRGE